MMEERNRSDAPRTHPRVLRGRKEIEAMNRTLQKELNGAVRAEIASLEKQLGILTARLEVGMLQPQQQRPVDTPEKFVSPPQIPQQGLVCPPSPSDDGAARVSVRHELPEAAAQANALVSRDQEATDGSQHLKLGTLSTAPGDTGTAVSTRQEDRDRGHTRAGSTDTNTKSGDPCTEAIEKPSKTDSTAAFCSEADRLVSSVAHDSSDAGADGRSGTADDKQFNRGGEATRDRDEKAAGQSRLSADTLV